MGDSGKDSGEDKAPIKSREMMYKAIVKAVLLYGREIWVVIDTMMTVLEGFYHDISRHIEGMTVRTGGNGELE